MQVKLKTIVAAAMVMVGGASYAQDMVVKIGHVGPTSGGIAHLGKDNENGAKMAIDDLNAKGTTIGGKKIKFELIPEDDAGDPKQGTAVAQKLVDSKVAGVIGHLNSGTTIPASKIYSDAGIPQISPSASNPQYTRQRFASAFRNIANDEQQGAALARYALQNVKARRIAVIDDRTAYGKGLADEFSKNIKRLGPAAGAAIVSTQYTTDKATDFNAILTSIRGKGPDLVFFGGMDSVGGPLLRQMKALGITAKYMGGDGVCTEALPKLAGAAAVNGVVYCAEAGGVTPAEQKNLDDFVARYKKKYNSDVQLYAPYVYDAVMTMAAAMQEAKSSQPAKYLPLLQKINYQGVTGLIAFDQFGDIKDGALTLFTYKDGKKTKVEVVK